MAAADIGKPQASKYMDAMTFDMATITWENLHTCLEDYGVCVITGVVDSPTCSETLTSIVNALENLGGGASRSDPYSFDNASTMQQTRTGLYQKVISNIPQVWNIRTHPNVCKIFEAIHNVDRSNAEQDVRVPISSLTDQIPGQAEELMVSSDGICYIPARRYDSAPDWAHLDQSSGCISEVAHEPVNIQGQIVLTTSPHTFRCSTRSHKIHERVMNLMKSGDHKYDYNKTDAKLFIRMPVPDLKSLPRGSKANQKYDELMNMMTEVEGEYQVLIPAPGGSMILWDAKCIHSALRYPDVESERGLVYVCMRKKCYLSSKEQMIRANSFLTNLTTSHWGVNNLKARKQTDFRSQKATNIFDTPYLAYMDLYDAPALTVQVKGMTCLTDVCDPHNAPYHGMYGSACEAYEAGDFDLVHTIVSYINEEISKKESGRFASKPYERKVQRNTIDTYFSKS